ncbi:MAG: 30S ribosomal protein S20 [Elusimicrobiota bacterium]
MANHKSAIKHWRKSLYRNSVNKRNKSILNTHIKKLRKAIKEKDKETATQLLPLTFSIIDRTVKK